MILSVFVSKAAWGSDGKSSDCPLLLQHSFTQLNSSKQLDMCGLFKGKVLLIVNTASQCGFTPQYKQLEALHQAYSSRGFAVIGFPSNDFRQDRGSEADTAKVCYLDYGVTFPMAGRTAVTGSQANPVFKQLAAESGVEPNWNFFKYLIDRKGNVVAVFASRTQPTDALLTGQLEQLLR
ncbi:glutathione peroxidase [Photobacterium aquae]|uniref:Glutathione peroxidase n=1 Tax=Photobacterium aquae TaxID=1195763 RepID=A0A0J1H099_9GAMM|nr:glutathione peroxidase [Photobacterium aquae]KLV05253.1 glutathione peroxidase [Photobacterium aquae]